MSNTWILSESFESTRRLISAINTLSIHTKLCLAGRLDAERADEAKAARELLRAFFAELAKVVPELERDPNSPLPGSAPRASLFARRFVQARRKNPTVSLLLRVPVSEFAALFDAEDEEQQRLLVEGLQTLREMLEQHHHADATAMFGEL